ELRAAANEVNIIIVPAEEFRALTRSPQDAVFLMHDGRPTVALREGANPRALREEGVHFLQSREPEWAKNVAAFDERNLARWREMSDAERVVSVRKAIDIEVDAAQRLRANAQELLRSNPRDREARIQLEDARAALVSLERRSAAVAAFDDAALRAIDR